MKFYNMKDKPLNFSVKNGKKVMIPKGATNVKIAFRQSHLRRFDEELMRYVPMNVYIWRGICVHA